MISSNIPVGIFLIPFFSALLVLVIGLLVRGSARIISLGALVGMSGVALGAGAAVLQGATIRTTLGGWMPPLGIELILDPFALFGVLLISIVSLLIFAGTRDSIELEFAGRQPFFYAVSLLLIAGLTGLVLAGDLFNLFVHLEVASLSAAALVACGKRGAPRAGLRYLIVGSLGASLYLLGVGFVYAAVGTLNMADVSQRIVAGLASGEVDPRLVSFSAVLIFIGLSIKMGLFPLHGWMPDAYSFSPNCSAMLMVPLVTKISALALTRVMFFVFGSSFFAGGGLIAEGLVWCGALAFVYGGLRAFQQTNIRRILVYSSIAQMGIVAVGLGLCTVDGMVGAMLHLANDALMKAVLFIAAATLVFRYGITDLKDLAGLRAKAPALSAAIAIAGLSLVGIPPLAGFFGKWYVLSAAVSLQRWSVVAFLILGSLATIAYILKIIEQIYFSGAKSSKSGSSDVMSRFKFEIFISLIFALLIILVGLANERIVTLVVMPGISGLDL